MSLKIDNFQNYNVELKVETILNPSEDPDKVKKCLINVANGCQPVIKKEFVTAVCEGILSLHNIRVGVRSKSSFAVLRRVLDENRKDDRTWFFLNKQAAYCDVISIIEHDEESTLGPIRVTITSNDLDKIIEWLIPSRIRSR